MGPKVFLYKGRKLLSYKAYILILSAFWVYSIIWGASLVLLYIYRDSLSVYVEAVCLIILIIISPSANDLFLPYKKYKVQWETSNIKQDPGQNKGQN